MHKKNCWITMNTGLVARGQEAIYPNQCTCDAERPEHLTVGGDQTVRPAVAPEPAEEYYSLGEPNGKIGRDLLWKGQHIGFLTGSAESIQELMETLKVGQMRRK